MLIAVIFVCIFRIEVFAASAPNGIYGNGAGGIYIDINADPYVSFSKIATWGQYAYGKQGCAWYASARVKELTGKGNMIYSGASWWNNGAGLYGFSTGSIIQEKAIACYSGHVAIVEKIVGDTVYLSEGGYSGGNVTAQNGYTIIRATTEYGVTHNGSNSFLGYVYLPGSSSGTTSDIFSSAGTASEITDTSAKIFAKLNGTYNVSTCGFDIGLSPETMGRVTENANTKVNSMWYSLGNGSKWYGTLQPGTTYYYRFYAIINGVEHTGAVQSFTTTGHTICMWGVDEGKKINVAQHLWAKRFDSDSNHYAEFYIDGNLITGHLSADANGYFSVWVNPNDHTPGNHVITVKYYNTDWMWEHSKTIVTEYSDTEPPVISNVRITNQTKDGYTVICTVTDNMGVNRVQFPTWTEANGGDDLVTEWGNNPAVSGSINGSQVSFRVNASDHNGEMGLYHTHIYAYDNCSNGTSQGVSVVLDNIPPVISDVQVTDVSETGYTVTCTVVDDVQLNRVQFPTWTAANGQDDLAQDWWNNTSITGNIFLNWFH